MKTSNKKEINSKNQKSTKTSKIKVPTSTITTSKNPPLTEKLILPPPSEAHSNIVTNQKVDSYLYLELYNNLNSKDDMKALAICRLSTYLFIY